MWFFVLIKKRTKTIFEDDSEAGSEVEEAEVEEYEELHEAEHTPHVEHDKLDPPITKVFTYPRMKEFKLALSQHAIKHEFEYDTEYSTPHRFRGYCSRRDADNCPWRIHASMTEHKCT
uniref:Transposase MuDR plant domain-containing protein n=1 Tax=Triticum urartu TaxID=4572 RepID=A0A8R7RDA3_TRIUA